MKNKYNTLIFLQLFCLTQVGGGLFSAMGWAALPKKKELTLEETIRLTVTRHPRTKADQLREEAVQKNINIARSRYYPRINVMALITNGFPGSAGATGIGGLMVSPYHQGPSAGFLLEQDIWDFGRTSGNITVAEKESELAQADSKVLSLAIARSAIQSFYGCAKDKSMVGAYEEIQRETQNIAEEVEAFVRKGQRSIVDRYLSQSQSEEAVTSTQTYKKRLELDIQELMLLTGKREGNCPPLPDNVVWNSAKSEGDSPYVEQAEKKTEVSKARMELAKKDYLPRIVGMGSVGVMQGTELNTPMKNYSVAAGVIFPLFEGFKTNEEVERERIRTFQYEQEKEAIQQDIQQANFRYDRSIRSSWVQIDHLEDELRLAEKAFSVAKTRYQNTQGNLIDLREAVRNLARTNTQLRDAQAIYLSQLAEKSILNGGMEAVIEKDGGKEKAAN